MILLQQQARSIFPQPPAVFLKIGHDRADSAPELFRVVMEHGVHELMNDHIVHDCQRCQDEPPGET